MDEAAYYVRAEDIVEEEIITVTVECNQLPDDPRERRISWADHFPYDLHDRATRTQAHREALDLARRWASTLHRNPQYGNLPTEWGSNF
jgi:hypothetical protein